MNTHIPTISLWKPLANSEWLAIKKKGCPNFLFHLFNCFNGDKLHKRLRHIYGPLHLWNSISIRQILIECFCLSSVAASLVVKVFPERVQEAQGRPVTLRCQVSGYPPHYFHWSREDGRPISSTAERRTQGTVHSPTSMFRWLVQDLSRRHKWIPYRNQAPKIELNASYYISTLWRSKYHNTLQPSPKYNKNRNIF